MHNQSDKVDNDKTKTKPAGPADYLANERTFLAWVRTGIAVMAFGFVVVKFNLFLEQAAFLVGNEVIATNSPYSTAIGIILVALGTVTTLLAFLRYRRIEKQLQRNEYFPSFVLSLLLTIIMLVAGGLLVFYLST